MPWGGAGGQNIEHPHTQAILSFENGVSVLVHSFFIEYSSKLQVTRTSIKAQTSSIFWPLVSMAHLCVF